MWVRLTVLRANELNQQIEGILGRKAESITKNKELRKYINSVYKDIVMPYVPMSDADKEHHLKDAYITDDGRIIWSATNKGYNYASDQYETPSSPIPDTKGTGTYYHPVRYEGHKPIDHWTKRVRPDAEDKGPWESFIAGITDEVTRAYKNG